MNRFSHFIVSSWAATAVAALLCVITWGCTIIQGDTGDILSYVNLLLYLALGVLTGCYGDRLSTGTRKVTLPTTLFFMSCAINPQLAAWQESTVYLLLIAGAYHILLNTYRNHTAMGSYFTAFCLIGIVSLHCPQLLYIVPVLVLSCGFMQSLHVRTVLAALLGLLTPYWVAFCILFVTDNIPLIQSFVNELAINTLQPSSLIHIPLGGNNTIAVPMIIVQLAWTLFLVVPAIAHHILSVTSKVRTRANRYMQISYISILLVSTLLLPSLYTALQPAVVALTAILSYDFFTVEKKSRSIWFIALSIIWLLILGLYIWNNFLTY